ncbi:MAG: D-alanine--D-alanine ligase [Armatimonadetes bacterium]|nr:D-alanine--D-alanine ligase [Armatimonadota bacterium]
MRKPEEIQTAFSSTELLEGCSEFFFVGIGGAGMAGIAELLLDRGAKVRGVDSTEQDSLAKLRVLGVEIGVGAESLVPKPTEALVVSDAIDLERNAAIRVGLGLGCKMFRRSQVLGWLLRGRKVIAVTGTHGKTTTTGMIGAGLIAAGFDPLVVVGAEVPEFGGALFKGTGEWAVIEACEAYDATRDLQPDVAVLTNLEPDHLDFHGSFENLQDAIKSFLQKSDRAVVPQGDESARWVNGRGTTFSAANVSLTVPGEHNRKNAGAALAVAEIVGADRDRFIHGISEYQGAARRLQTVYSKGPVVIDDYAHHPTEIAASIEAVRQLHPNRRLLAVFQPHLYSRTRDFLADFPAALNGADFVLITDIYPAREDPIAGISSARIAEKLTVPYQYVPSRHLLSDAILSVCETNDVILIMGAGNIAELPPRLIAKLERPNVEAVWVVYGGDSPEREVSLHSGRQMAAALQRKGYQATLVDVTDLLLAPKPHLPTPLPDAAILAVHGTHAEDGAIQGFFEILHIPYSGSAILPSAIAMDKNLTKMVLAQNGLPVPKGVVVRSSQESAVIPGVERYVVKPNAQGSTVGLTFVEQAQDLPEAIETALRYGEVALVEEWVTGMEISVPVLGDRVLPAVEIRPVSGQYDFANKYLPGATEEICPARLPGSVTSTVQDYALRSHRALGCSGATRTDMIVDGDRITILEVNTLPGMTTTSLLPNSARTAGISYDDLCEWILKDALSRNVATC